uniref:Uncharacterized protein n=1 Tax=Ignavibacterium album TaxID=591197 RepID=A0A832G8I4_9BACT
MKAPKTFLTFFFLLFFACEIFSQGIPQTINYQGVLKDASGNIVTNGDYNLTFKIYDSETGGTPLWTETKLINVVDGIFSTQLGSVTPLTLSFDNAYWLGVTVGSGSELTPRIAFTSVPYSRMSLTIPDNSLTSNKIHSGQVVKSLNGLKDDVNLVAGSNVTITPSGNNLTISSASGAGGTVTQVNTGAGLTGGPITTTGTISIANDGIATAMLQNNSVTTDKIVDGTITATDIANTQVVKSINSLKDNVNLVAGSNVTITPSGNNLTISAASGAGGTVTQVNTGAGLTGGPITTTGTISIANDGIATAMLQNNSVTTDKIVDGTISTNDLANNSVTSTKIADGTITTSDLSDNSVTTAKIVDGTIATSDLANNSVTTDKIVDGTITATDIGSTQVVKSLNAIKDNVNLVAGSNITITPSGQNLTISSTSGGMGGSGTTNYLPVFTGTTSIGNSILYQSGTNKIGLNTSSPDFALTIDANPTAGLGLKISRNGGFDMAFIEAGQPVNSKGWAFDIFEQKFKINTTQDNGYTAIRNLITFDRNGNVGIGTISPSYPLHVSTNRKYAGYFTSDSLSGSTHVIHAEFTGAGNDDPIAVYGKSRPSDYYGFGGLFEGGFVGVYGKVTSTGANYYYGVGGYAGGGNGTNYGIWGSASGSGTNYGVWGEAYYGTTNWAGYFSGNVNVTGTLSKGGGSFKIDHPLDPQNKYLYHSFVESPDMKNMYDGTITTDASGYATVTLPEWFEALNKDFRYQLTVIGDFAQAIIAQEIQNNQFAIRTDKPNVKVSWQVTGIRKDAFAEKYRIPVEEYKQGDDVGKYLHPEAYGLPETMGIDYKHSVEEQKRGK